MNHPTELSPKDGPDEEPEEVPEELARAFAATEFRDMLDAAPAASAA